MCHLYKLWRAHWANYRGCLLHKQQMEELVRKLYVKPRQPQTQALKDAAAAVSKLKASGKVTKPVSPLVCTRH